MNNQLIPKNLTKYTCFVCLLFIPVFTSAQDTNSEDEIYELEPVTVVGTRIRGIDLETTLPLITLDVGDLELTGYSRVDDTLRDLPMMAGYGEAGVSGGAFEAQGTRGVSMRGMGSAGNLVLIDGLRMSLFDGGGHVVPSYNIGAIPMCSIQGVQILSDGASAIYGSDAISGVINFRTIKEFDGTRIEIDLGKVEGTQSDEATIVLTHGMSIGDKGNLVLAFNHYERNNLPKRDYKYQASTNYLDRGGRNFSSEGSYPALLYITDEQNPTDDVLTFPKPTSQPSIDGLVIQPWPLGENDGGYNFNAVMDHMGDNKESGMYLHYDYILNSTTKAFIDLFYQKSYTRITMAPTPYFNWFDFPFPSKNPHNPFGVSRTDGGEPNDIWLLLGRFADTDPRITETTIQVPRIVAGLEGEFWEDWDWQAAAVWSESQSERIGFNHFDWDRFDEVIAGYDLDGNGQLSTDEYFNPFGSNSDALYDHMRITRTSGGNYELWMLDANVTGELLRKGKLSLKTALGTEFRRERMIYDEDSNKESGVIIGSEGKGSDVEGSREIAAAYGELQFKYDTILTIMAAGRIENYSDFGTTANPKISLSLKVAPEILIRGSYGEGFIAPTIPALHKPIYAQPQWGGNYFDPKRDEWMDYSFMLNTGGNPDLDPETSTNYSAGIVIEPFARLKNNASGNNWLKGITLGSNYIQIDYVNLWDFPDVQFLLDNEDQLDQIFPGGNISIKRDSPLPDDPSSVGSVSTINQLFSNVSFQEYRGYDFWMEWHMNLESWGMLKFRWDGTWIDTLNYAGDERAGALGGGIPKSRWTASLEWKIHDWATALYFREIDGFGQDPRDETIPTAEDSFRINAQISYSGLENTRITLGARNILNEDPSFSGWSVSGFHWAHPSEKRFWYLRMERNF